MLTFQRGFKHLLIKVLGRLFVLDDGVFIIHPAKSLNISINCETKKEDEVIKQGNQSRLCSENLSKRPHTPKLYLWRGSMHPPAPKTFQAFPRTAQQ
jgi:hypothetical protein